MFDPLLNVLATFGKYFLQVIICIPCAIIAISVRNYAQGLVAYLLGDKSIIESKRFSFNPIRHIEPIGFLCLTLFRFGWANPVPFNPKKFKNSKLGTFLVVLAGTLSNFIVGFIFTFILCILVYKIPAYKIFIEFPSSILGGFGEQAGNFIYQLLVNTVQSACMLNLTLMVFNFIPLPPLDGFKVLSLIIPRYSSRAVIRYERYFSLFFLVILFIDMYFTGYVNNVFGTAVNFFMLNWFQPLINLIIF